MNCNNTLSCFLMSLENQQQFTKRGSFRYKPELFCYDTGNPTMQLIMSHSLLNKPLPSSKNSNFQNEAKSKTFFVIMSFFFIRIKKDFHITCFALSLALKQRLGETWKWPSHSTVTGWQEFLFPIKFQHYASRLLLFVDFLRYEFSNKF